MKGMTTRQKVGWSVITIVVLVYTLGPLVSIQIGRASCRERV